MVNLTRVKSVKPSGLGLKTKLLSHENIERAFDTSKFSPHRRFLDRYWNSWWPETVALSLSVGCSITIAAILGCYNRNPIPKLPLSLSINAVVAILATTSKVSLIFAVSNCLGQLKWVWFSSHHSRALVDAQFFDDASRGPLGSFRLLWFSTRRSTASLGALIIVVTLVFDPFVQQVIVYETKQHFSPSSEVFTHSAYRLNYSIADVVATQVITSALVRDDFDLNPNCKSSNCRWPPFRTFAWCGECDEGSTWEVSETCNTNWTLNELESTSQALLHDCTASRSDGLSSMSAVAEITQPEGQGFDSDRPGVPFGISFLTLPSHQTSVNNSLWQWMNSPNKPSDLIEPAFAFSVLNFSIKPDSSLSVQGTSCKLDLCSRDYQINVVNGTTHASFSKKSLKKTLLDLQKDIPGQNLSGLQRSVCFEVPENPSIDFTKYTYHGLDDAADIVAGQAGFCISGYSIEIWTDKLQEIVGNITYNLQCDIYNDTSSESSFNLMSNCEHGIPEWKSSYPYGGIWVDRGPNVVIDNLANSLTRVTFNPSININSTTPIFGEIGEQVTHLKVRWPWLALPYALSVGGVMLLVITILESKRVEAPLWKSSMMAFIYHGIDRDYDVTSDLRSIPQMDKEAADTRVRLSHSDNQTRLRLYR